ncbi:MAG TPA: hypothetical protein VI932_02320 [Bacteroidota bacterium]|nr:hypothetical protein [Bacteroidota bacterium]
MSSRAWAQDEQTTVGGYGELHYNEPDGTGRGQLDFHRFVLYYAHTFSDRVSFQSELELEHTRIEAGDEDGGEIAIEQAYLEWRFAGSTGLRAGIVLVPMGIINERHEPATFNGVERPNVDRTIIPSTWREAGLGLYGKFSDALSYQAYVVAGLKAEGFSGSGGIRGGRQSGFRSDPVNPSFAGRLDYLADASLKLGGSVFAGNTTGGVSSMGSGMLLIVSGDAEFRQGNFALRAVGVYGSLGDADKINTAFGRGVADNFYGFYGEGAYDIMPHIDPLTETSLILFARYEKYNTQSTVTGFQANPVNDRDEITIGATLKPTYNTAFKVDYQFLNNGADVNTKALNFGIGYQFN